MQQRVYTHNYTYSRKCSFFELLSDIGKNFFLEKLFTLFTKLFLSLFSVGYVVNGW